MTPTQRGNFADEMLFDIVTTGWVAVDESGNELDPEEGAADER